jgi:hypothetical protein
MVICPFYSEAIHKVDPVIVDSAIKLANDVHCGIDNIGYV